MHVHIHPIHKYGVHIHTHTHTTAAGYCSVIPQSSYSKHAHVVVKNSIPSSQLFIIIFVPCRDCFVHFTFNFHFSVAKEVTNLISSGHTPPEDLLDSTNSHLTAPKSHTPTQDISASPKKLILETSVSDHRLWYEILRNLSKDLKVSKSSLILLPESALSNNLSNEKLPIMLEGTERAN